jgi:hypothetical protein
MPWDPGGVVVDPVSGRAVMQAKNMPMPDYHDFVSSVTGGIPDPGIVSFRTEWLPSVDQHHYSNAARGWQGDFVTNHATCRWSGRTRKAEFHTDTVDPEIFAEVGRERNGVFFA